jgi:hypothetical protein
MPSNHKGKGMKGRNYDELSGVGTSSAGHDGGAGTPDLADEGNLQSAGNQQSGPGDNAQRGYSGSQQSAGQQSASRGSQQSGDQLRGEEGDRKLAARQASQDKVGTAKPSKR